MLRVPVVLIFVPPNKYPPAEFIVPVTERLPTVPASVNVKSVLGEPSASEIVNVPFVPAVAIFKFGDELERISGDADENVLVLLNVFA